MVRELEGVAPEVLLEGGRVCLEDAAGQGAAVLAWQASSAGADRIFLQRVQAGGTLGWGPQGLDLTHGNWKVWNPALHGDGQASRR